jgi:anti-anti-sigma regulatory factor
MTAVRELCSHDGLVLCIEGPLRAPVNVELRHRIRALLRRGERRIVLDLARIDAAGVGEIVRAYNMTFTANGMLRIVRATAWVREILQRLGILEVLSAGREPDRGAA